MTARFVVGIDLGTTHTVVAYAAIDSKRKGAPEPRILDVMQLTSASDAEALALLPSCLYAPISGEVADEQTWIVGEMARRRGAEVVGRTVSSAKSWLSHGNVDRLAPILPWGVADAPELERPPRLSPVEASAKILAHIREAWDRDFPDARLSEQDVILTLPASFDEVSRELTRQAAEQAGLHPVLLEEPTAAFYSLLRNEAVIRELVERCGASEGSVLVCDVGGGTTDLSLMGVAKASAPPWFSVRRIAVGRHLLLGGDNMDLALAGVAEERIVDKGGTLGAAEFAQLVVSCRDAKEVLLAHGAPDQITVAVLGRASKLVGDARSATLTREDVERIVLGGFFPAQKEHVPSKSRGGVVAFGLPYERNPAITSHVVGFLKRHATELPRGTPDAILLNGGVFRAKPIVQALVRALADEGGRTPSVLHGSDPDLAVARGAVLYGFARRGTGVRIESGASRGYYVALAPVERQEHVHAVCILPRGASEGVRYSVRRSFDLALGHRVRFDLYASDVARDDVGTVVTLADGTFERLPPITAHLPSSGKRQALAVHLGGELLTTGQLELSCSEAVALEGVPGRTYRLEFQLRESSSLRPSRAPVPPSFAPPQVGDGASSLVDEGARILDRVFGRRTDAMPREVKDVVRDLEKVLGERGTWTMDVARALADRLLINTGARHRTPDHERAYWSLLGFCMRPGFGDALDSARIECIYPLFSGRLAFPNEARAWPQFFIAWRRMSGGLAEGIQTMMRDALDPLVAPPEAKLKKPKRVPEGADEVLTTLAALERVSTSRRVQLGDWTVEKTWSSKDARLWTAIGRIGARVPLYASVHHVVPPTVAEIWIELLLRQDWASITTAAYAAVQLARVTGDRARDVSQKTRTEVSARLEAISARPEWVRAVRELVEVDDDDRVSMLGENLPLGLRLSVDGSPGARGIVL